MVQYFFQLEIALNKRGNLDRYQMHFCIVIKIIIFDSMSYQSKVLNQYLRG